MTRFLNGGALVAAVRRVLGGTDVRCAVAFWGEGATEFLEACGARPEEVSIVCDISMGATSPKELRSLGAPENDRLRERSGLHAKVYLSSEGVVVGSANMSANGVGFGSEPGLCEAGVFLPPDGEAARDAADWFRTLHDGAQPIGETELRHAEARYRPHRAMIPPTTVREGSLLDLVVADPDSLGDVGFVFCRSEVTSAELRRAKRDVAKLHASRADEIDEWDEGRMFVEWDKRDVDHWPERFVEYFRPETRVKVSLHAVEMRHRTKGHVLTRNGKSLIRASMSGPLPTSAEIRKADQDLATEVIKAHGDKVFRSARELRPVLLRLRDPAKASVS